jgi:Zn-finger nucleic acid-binding protein
MRCPRDGQELESVRYEGGVLIDRCPTCRGTFLDAGELEAVETTIEHDYARELQSAPDDVRGAYERARHQLDPVVPCPKCGRTMARREYGYCSQILIDVCPDGEGLWLERGELEALELFFERSRLETATLRERFLRGLKQFFSA